MNEFRRLINRKVVIGFIALLIINVSLYVYQQTKGAGLKELRFETAQRQWCVDYYGNYDIEAAINAVDSDIERILSYRKADKQGVESEAAVENYTSVVFEKYKPLSDSEQLLFLTVLRDVESQLEYISKYPEDIRQIQTNAQQLMTFSIFSDKNSFTYNNIVKTGKDFEKVADVSLYLINIRQLIRVAYEQVLVVAVVQITHFPSVEFYSIDKCSVWIEYKYFFINKISNLGCTSCTTVTHIYVLSIIRQGCHYY